MLCVIRIDDRLKVFEMDGRVYVKRAIREGKKYDAILLDAFDQDYIPEHLLNRQGASVPVAHRAIGGCSPAPWW
jgi:spermidine synthase